MYGWDLSSFLVQKQTNIPRLIFRSLIKFERPKRKKLILPNEGSNENKCILTGINTATVITQKDFCVSSDESRRQSKAALTASSLMSLAMAPGLLFTPFCFASAYEGKNFHWGGVFFFFLEQVMTECRNDQHFRHFGIFS
ncbi:hypothetical protein CDAR_488141 [Caerostris darwini]|uniref:Uncharacterized protein n=1 Tax=Caerostris darwini TaxID=1538125 RepID=A0AAV4R4G5_9ARAC|nr:hypothetical protein CDAR_488141 [Caerostris darwini]